MKITQDMVENLSFLSRLKLSGDEKKQIQEDLNQIVNYIGLLENLDTTGVKPMSHIFDIKNVFRKDKVCKSYDREDLLKNAPKHDAESFIVPKTVE